MNEPKFVTKEEIDRRQEIINKDKADLELIREKRSKLSSRSANVNYDLTRMPSDRLKQEKIELDSKLKAIEINISYYVSDIAQSEKILKKDKKDYSAWNRYQRQKELQDRTLPTASRDNLGWTLNERDVLSVVDHNDDEEMVETAIILNRTYYGCDIEWRRLKGVTKRS